MMYKVQNSRSGVLHTNRFCSAFVRNRIPPSKIIPVPDSSTAKVCHYCSYHKPGYKLCTGPGHDKPTWLPATEKYFCKRRDGLHNRCRLCINWNKLKSPGESGYVSAFLVVSFFKEGVFRVGLTELSRRTGISKDHIGNVLNGKQKRLQKQTVRRLMLELISMRRKGEARHRKSIRYGDYIRGRPERIPVHRKDFNGIDDTDNERHRKARREKAA